MVDVQCWFSPGKEDLAFFYITPFRTGSRVFCQIAGCLHVRRSYLSATKGLHSFAILTQSKKVCLAALQPKLHQVGLESDMYRKPPPHIRIDQRLPSTMFCTTGTQWAVAELLMICATPDPRQTKKRESLCFACAAKIGELRD